MDSSSAPAQVSTTYQSPMLTDLSERVWHYNNSVVMLWWRGVANQEEKKIAMHQIHDHGQYSKTILKVGLSHAVMRESQLHEKANTTFGLATLHLPIDHRRYCSRYCIEQFTRTKTTLSRYYSRLFYCWQNHQHPHPQFESECFLTQ